MTPMHVTVDVQKTTTYVARLTQEAAERILREAVGAPESAEVGWDIGNDGWLRSGEPIEVRWSVTEDCDDATAR